MKRFFIFLFFHFLILDSQLLDSQNLVPNPSFELYDTCPNLTFQIHYANGWSSYGNTPDYFNSCDTQNTFASVPFNFFGYQTPLNGNAYAGFYSYSDGGADFREMIGAPLASALNIGQKYYVTFNIVNAGITAGPGFNCCTNKIGMQFSTNPYSYSNPMTVGNNAKIYTDSIIKDTVNWQTISGSFIADSSYQYFAIGNFFDDSNTDTVKFNTWACQSYYFVDGICISTDSIFCNSWLSINEKKLERNIVIYPNPSNGIINIQSDTEINSVKIINLLGERLFESIFITKKDNTTFSLDCSEFPTGFYLVNIYCGQYCSTKKIIIN